MRYSTRFRPGNARIFAAIALIATIAAAPRPAAAQRAAGDRPCPYDACALRLAGGGLFTPMKLVRGIEGTDVASLGVFGSDVDALFESSDSALAYARSYTSAQRTGAVLLLAGTIAYVAGAGILADWTAPGRDNLAIGLLIGGAGAQIVGSIQMQNALTAMGQAIWWHNRELAR